MGPNINTAGFSADWFEPLLGEGGVVWVVAESKLVCERIARVVTEAQTRDPRFTQITALTVPEVIFHLGVLSREQSPRLITLLNNEDALEYIRTVLVRTREVFPSLYQQTMGGIESHADSAPLASLYRFLDLVRQFDISEKLLRETLDEFGETKRTAVSTEEFLRFRDTVQTLQREHGFYDLSGLAESVVERLESAGEGKYSIPTDISRIVLFRPSYLSPLMERIWRALSVYVPTTILEDGGVSAVRCCIEANITHPLASVVERVLALGKIQRIETRSLCEPNRSAFDSLWGEAPASTAVADLPLQIVGVGELWDEVRFVADIVSEALSDKSAGPLDIQIVVPNHDRYETLLSRCLTERGVPFEVHRGYQLKSTIVGVDDSSVLRWLEEGSLVAFDNYAALGGRRFQLDRKIWETFAASYAQICPEIESIQFDTERRGVDLEPVSSLFEEQGIVLQSELNPEYVNDSVSALLQLWHRRLRSNRAPTPDDRARFAATAMQLALLVHCCVVRQQVCVEVSAKHAATALAQVRCVQRAIRSIRGPRAPIARSNRERRSIRAQALAQIRNIWRQTIRSCGIAYGSGSAPLSVIRRMFVDRLDSARCRPHGESRSAVTITDLRESAAVFGHSVIVLGFTADAFPPSVGETVGDEFQTLGARFRESDDVLLSYWELGRLLRCSKEILITYPLQHQFSAAPILSDLSRSTRLHKSPQTPLLNRVLDTVDAPSTEQFEYPSEDTMNLLQARRSEQFTPYDGVVGSSDQDSDRALFQRASARMFLRSGATRYSASSLESYVECPHRFFFTHILNLDVVREPLDDRIPRILGDFVHEVLATYFAQYPEPFRDADFEQALLRLAGVAHTAASKSPYEWNAHPALQYAHTLALSGLPDHEVRRPGMLRVALEIQQHFFSANGTCAVEQTFGRNDWPTLKLESEAGEIVLHGAIDRIDRLPNGDLAVWDYKTGQTIKYGQRDVDKGKAFQLVLYALAVQQNQGQLPSRGGLLCLARPLSQYKELDSPTRGPVVEHLSGGSGDTEEASTSQVVARVVNASAEIQRIHAQVTRGIFSQQKEMARNICEQCHFRRICARDVKLLEAKTTTQGAASPPRLLPNRLPRPEVRLLSPLGPRADYALSEEQQQAAEISQSVVLNAGAGSGKTRVLVSRFVRHLLDGVPAKRIVAVTFTEKASFEMRNRIENTIAAAIETGFFEGRRLSANEVTRLGQARFDLPASSISTIHSFAGRVVAHAGTLLRNSSRRSEASTADTIVLRDEAIRNTLLYVRPNGSRAAIQTLLALGVRFPTIEKTISNLLAQPSSFRRLKFTFHVSAGKYAPQISMDVQGTIHALYERIGERTATLIRSRVQESIPDFERWLRVSKGVVAARKKGLGEAIDQGYALIQKVASTRVAEVGEIAFQLYELLDSTKLSNRPGDPRNEWNALRDELETMLCGIAMPSGEGSLLSSTDSDAVLATHALVYLAAEAEALFQAEKNRSGLTDFDDLLTDAHHALYGIFSGTQKEQQRGVRERLRAEILHLMVDEFQDTDSIQWEILKGAFGFDGSLNPDRTLFIVGDPKQSIYRFRGADVRVFEQASNEISAAGGKTYSLVDNYRSSPAIVEFVNGLFGRILNADFDVEGRALTDSAVRPQAMVARRRAEGAAVHRLDASKHNIPEIVADAVALALSGKAPYSPARKERGAIAVLASKQAELDQISYALTDRGIQYSRGKSNALFFSAEIQQFYNITRFLGDTRDHVALVGALRSPIVGASDRDLLEILAALNGDWDCLLDVQPETVPTVSHLVRRVQDLVTRAKAQTPIRFLESLLDSPGFRDAFFRIGLSSVFRDMERFLSMLSEQIRASTIDVIAELTTYRGLAQHMLELAEDRASGVESIDTNAPVILLTIHGAKGLEFPTVFLPYLDWRNFNAVGGTCNEGDNTFYAVATEDAAGDYVRVRSQYKRIVETVAKREEIAEQRRKFYVACTRAEEHLVLVTLPGDRNADPDAIYAGSPERWLNEASD